MPEPFVKASDRIPVFTPDGHHETAYGERRLATWLRSEDDPLQEGSPICPNADDGRDHESGRIDRLLSDQGPVSPEEGEPMLSGVKDRERLPPERDQGDIVEFTGASPLSTDRADSGPRGIKEQHLMEARVGYGNFSR